MATNGKNTLPQAGKLGEYDGQSTMFKACSNCDDPDCINSQIIVYAHTGELCVSQTVEHLLDLGLDGDEVLTVMMRYRLNDIFPGLEVNVQVRLIGFEALEEDSDPNSINFDGIDFSPLDFTGPQDHAD